MFYLSILTWHTYCDVINASFFLFVIDVQIISSGQPKSTSRAQGVLSGPIFYSLLVVFKHLMLSIILEATTFDSFHISDSNFRCMSSHG